jgi:hypothetical protein
MRTSALRRAVGAWVVLSISALILGSGIVGNTFATFNAETTNANSTFSDGWLGAATAGSATAGGYDMTVNWTPTTTGPITGQKILGVDNTTNNNCTGAAYAAIATLASATTATYSDLSRATSGTDGDWFCYELMSTSTSAPNWTTPYSFPAVQIGIVANAITTASGGTAGSVSKNDTITVTFNQRTTLASQASMTVCVFRNSSGNAILLGDTSGCASAATDTYTIGKLTPGSATLGTNVSFTASSSTVVTTAAPWTVKVTISPASNSTSAITGTPTWTFTPATTIKSNQTSHQATICTSGANCQPTDSTTSF